MATDDIWKTRNDDHNMLYILEFWTWKMTYIDMTEIAESMRKFWIWVNFWLKKKNGERLLLWTTEHVNVWTNEHYSALNFFRQKLRHIQKLQGQHSDDNSTECHLTWDIEYLYCQTCYMWCRGRRRPAADRRCEWQKERTIDKVCRRR